MFAHGVDGDLTAGQLDRRKLRRDLRRDLGGDAPGAAVRDAPLGVDAAEVAAGGEVRGPQRDVDARRLEDASPDLVDQRVVAEEREVAGAGAGRDAVADGDRLAERTVGREAVEVAAIGGLQLAAPDGPRQPAEPVEDAEQHLALARNR